MALTAGILQNQTFEYEQYSKTSGIVATTYYEVLHLTKGAEVLFIFYKQENTPTNAHNVTFRITIDGHVFTSPATAAAHGAEKVVFITGIIGFGGMGNLPALDISNANDVQAGHLAVNDTGGVTSGIRSRLKGQDIKIEYALATIDAGQTFDCEVYYLEKAY